MSAIRDRRGRTGGGESRCATSEAAPDSGAGSTTASSCSPADGTVKTFSLAHSTARLPDGWRKAHQTWMENADAKWDIEYVLCVDAGRESELPLLPEGVRLVVNHGRRCAVDGWNAAAAATTGKFIITVADDWFPPKNWDCLIRSLVPSFDGEHVLWVGSGGDHDIMTFSMLTRTRYERYGYIFYPEYIGMCADNDFTDVAKRDRVVIDARFVEFPHMHPQYKRSQWDGIYEWQHRPEAWKVGKEVYARRQAQGFAR